MKLVDWCKENGEFGEKLLSEYTGIKEDTGEHIPLEKMTHGSGIKIKWKCSEGHEWSSNTAHRTLCKSECPTCSVNNIRGVSKIRSKTLDEWCESNGTLGTKIRNEYQGIREDGVAVDIDKVACKSVFKMLWKCSNNHGWYASIASRTEAQSNCPYCAGSKVVSGTNDFYTMCIKDNKQYLIDQFVGLDENNKEIDIHNMSYKSSRIVWWKHTVDGIEHKWKASPKHRVLNNSNCPYCNSKKIMAGQNDLETWCNNNGDFGKILLSQFMGFDETLKDVKASEIAPMSYKKVYWRHTTEQGENHEWLATIYNRTYNRSMCPFCNTMGTSLQEQILYRCIKQAYPDTINRGKYKGYEFDIMIPSLNTYIEYGSKYYHEGREQRDLERVELCKKDNIRFISIMHDATKTGDNEIWTPDNIEASFVNNKTNLKKLADYILNELGSYTSKIDFDKAYTEAISFMQQQL